MHKRTNATEQALSDNPPALFRALHDTKDLSAAQQSLKKLKNLCKQQARKHLFEWLASIQGTLAGNPDCLLFQLDSASVTKLLSQVARRRAEVR